MKGAIVGGGYFARFHMDAWQRMPEEARIVAVVDTDLARAREFASQWGIAKVYGDVREMLAVERPDFVDIATRPEVHLPLTTLAAEAKAHVICQKPMAPTWEDSVAMVEVCRNHGVRLSMHENWRWQPWYREMRRQLPALGTPHYLGFRMRTGDGRGAAPYPSQPYFAQMPRLLIYETLVHFIDTARFLLGEIESVYCQTQRLNPLIAGEDAVQIHLRFRGGAVAVIDANRISGSMPPPVAFGEALLEGDQARISMSGEGDLRIRRYGEEEDQPIPFHKPSVGYKGDSILALQRHLIECLQTGRQSESEGSDYLRTVRGVFGCYESAGSGIPVSVSHP
jgi:D-apiose dehydrogenase